MNLKYDFSGKHFLVTGASSGIGRTTAVMLGKAGAVLSIVSRRETQLKETAALLPSNYHKVYSCDLNETEEIEALVEKSVSENGVLSGLVYCAGVAPSRPLKMTKKEDIEYAMTVNFYSFVEFMRCISKKQNHAEDTSCVAISSISSVVGYKGKIAYCSSKAALDASVRCMAHELADKKIRVNTIQPAWVDTSLYRRYIDNWGDNAATADMTGKELLGITDPCEIAAMAAYLLSDASKTITGSAVRIDSGYLS